MDIAIPMITIIQKKRERSIVTTMIMKKSIATNTQKEENIRIAMTMTTKVMQKKVIVMSTISQKRKKRITLTMTSYKLEPNSEGILTLTTDKDGIWHLRTIHLVSSEEEGLTHESNWATLTFEVGHGHSHEEDHHHHEEEGGFSAIPSYVYWVASFALILGLFFWFNRNNA